jgi:hypothetical protein
MDTRNGLVVGCLLRTGVPSITKICVPPVSAMASLVLSVTVAAKVQQFVMVGVVVVDTLDAPTVSSLSPKVSSTTDKPQLEGYDK